MENQNLNISWDAIFKISVIVIVFYLLYSIRDIFIWFIFALVIAVLFDPIIDFLQKKKVPRVLGAIAVYVSAFGILGLLVYLVVPIFAHEINQFVDTLPVYFERIAPPLQGLGLEAFRDIESLTRAFGENLETMSANVFSAAFSLFGGIASTIFVIATGFFLSIEDKVVERALMLIFPKRYEAVVLNIWQRGKRKVSGWFGARVLACLFVAVASYVTLLLFGVKYPFILALLAGVLNFIPYLGAAVTGVILFLLIFPLNMMKALFVLIAFILIQQIEGNVLSPVLMKKIIGLPPALVLISMVVGGKLWGVMGAILVIPLVGILFEFTKEFLRKKKEGEAITT